MTPLLPVPMKMNAKHELLRARAKGNILILEPLWIIPGLPQNELPCSLCNAENDTALHPQRFRCSGRGRLRQYTSIKSMPKGYLGARGSLGSNVFAQSGIAYFFWSSGQKSMEMLEPGWELGGGACKGDCYGWDAWIMVVCPIIQQAKRQGRQAN